MAEELFARFPGVGSPRPITEVRGTLLSSSLLVLREKKLFDRYLAKLAREHHDTILGMVAGCWLPVDVAVAHYTACDALGLDSATIASFGSSVGARIHLSVMRTLTRLTPGQAWTGLSLFERLWTRVFIGGGAAIYRVGPKDARIEVTGQPLTHIPYFCHSLSGVVEVCFSLFTHKVMIKPGPRPSAGGVVLRAAWV
jgi:hypothetical protein